MNGIEKCDFCYDNKTFKLNNHCTGSLNLSNKKLAIIQFDKGKNKLIGTLDVEYCPFCGSKLDNVRENKHMNHNEL